MLQQKSGRSGLWLGLSLWLALALSGCQGGVMPLSPAAVQQWLGAVQTQTAPASATTAESPAATAALTPAPTGAAEPTGPAAGAGSIPVALTIPAIGLEAAVTPMGWEPAMSGDQVTTRWVVPLDTVGWAVNSAETGAAGNVVLAGHQALGAALLRSLALGEVMPGQEIELLAADGATYRYRVSEVSPPIPAIGATTEETARAAAYLAPSTKASLTIVTGWPADTTTHRMFVVAELVDAVP